MSKKSELKKHRKETLPQIHYTNVYIDGTIETKQGYFTKTFVYSETIDFNKDVVGADTINNVLDILSNDTLFKFDKELTYFSGCYYLTLGVKANSYEESVKIFSDVLLDRFVCLTFVEKMNLLHEMYQNDDKFEERFHEFANEKKMSKKIKTQLGSKLNVTDIYSESYPLEERLKMFKKNGKISKDLILPVEFVSTATEMEFEGNYMRLFYLKNMPKYITKEFIEDILKIKNVSFSLYFKKLDQNEICEYTKERFADDKELKSSELRQKIFFETVRPELKRSANMGETMLLASLVIGVTNDSITELDKETKKYEKFFEELYVLKSLKYQQKQAFNSLLPFCNETLNIKNVIFYKNELEVEEDV